MKLQYACDTLGIDQSIDVLDRVGQYIDIIEVDLIFYGNGGMDALKRIVERYPNHEILLDLKYTGPFKKDLPDMDMAFKLGANTVTVEASCVTREEHDKYVEEARKHGGGIATEFQYVPDLIQRLRDCDESGAQTVTMGCNWSKPTIDEALEEVVLAKKICKNAKVCAQGGININNIEEVAKRKPDIILMGRGIYATPNLEEDVKKMREICDKYSD